MQGRVGNTPFCRAGPHNGSPIQSLVTHQGLEQSVRGHLSLKLCVHGHKFSLVTAVFLVTAAALKKLKVGPELLAVFCHDARLALISNPFIVQNALQLHTNLDTMV